MRFVCLVLLIFLCSCSEIAHLELESTFREASRPQIHRLGLLSDIHGRLDRLDGFLVQFKELKVQAILVSGDSVLNEQLSYGQSYQVEDETELATVLDHLEGAHVPVFVIPGNHEGRKIYKEAFRTERPHVKDLVHYRFVDLKGVDLVSLPGYYIDTDQTHRFLPTDGFFLSKGEIQNLSVLMEAKKDADPVLVITHGPPLSTLENGVDIVPGVGHTGSEELREVLLKNPVSFVVFGHIHEAGPQAENSTDRIPEGIFSSQLWINVGAVQDSHAGILEIKGNEASFRSLSE